MDRCISNFLTQLFEREPRKACSCCQYWGTPCFRPGSFEVRMQFLILTALWVVMKGVEGEGWKEKNQRLMEHDTYLGWLGRNFFFTRAPYFAWGLS